MKTLIIIRHAKTRPSRYDESDFERPLESIGIIEAEQMAHKLSLKIPVIDQFLCSTALRARMTCEIFCETYHYPIDQIEFYDKLYHAPDYVIHVLISSVNNKHQCIAIVCHNPGITTFVNELVYNFKIDNMPTSGVFAVQANCEDWKTFEAEEKKFLFFDMPKNN